MIETPKQVQATVFKLGVALHAKYPEESMELLDGPLQDIADFLNEKEGLDLSKGKSMEYVDEIADKLLGKVNAKTEN